jgi:hypothetical protein
MGQDRKDGEGGDPDVTADHGEPRSRAFDREIREAIRYEQGLFVKALAVLAVVAVIVIVRTLYFT